MSNETTETWRRGDESMDTIKINGKTIQAENESQYKDVPKPEKFAEWSNPQRAAWREGVNAAFNHVAPLVLEMQLEMAVSKLLRSP